MHLGLVDLEVDPERPLLLHWLDSKLRTEEDRGVLYDQVYFEGVGAPRKLAGFVLLMVFASIISAMGVLTDSTAVVQAAEEQGKYAFGYHSDMSKYGPKAHLTATTHHWGDYYVKTIKEVQAGTWKPTSVWGGYNLGMVKLSPLNDAIPAELQARIREMEKKMADGSLHAFAGPVVDQAGNTVVAAGSNMTDDQLNSMNYYVQGVASKIPN
jgi:hypothetical protein